MITVFTPSYNRRHLLKDLYESLLVQDTDNFEWLIVDDGSKDDTESYIKELKKENKININYIYKENGGKLSAYNVGLDNAKGDIFLCIDSDDIFKENVLARIESDFKKIKNNQELAGIMYVQNYTNDKKKTIGTSFPQDGLIDTYYNIYNKHKVTGDKLIVFKTEVAKKYHFPIMEGEKFVPEALIYNRISSEYKFKCSNFVTSYKEYLDQGYSNNYFKLVKRNPLGNMLYYKELFDIKKSLYNIYAYILFGIYGKKKLSYMVKDHSAKFRIVLLYIPVYFISKIKK